MTGKPASVVTAAMTTRKINASVLFIHFVRDGKFRGDMSERAPQSKTRLAKALISLLLVMPAVLRAQSAEDSTKSLIPYVTPLTLVSGMPSDRLRLDQLRGQADLDGY